MRGMNEAIGQVLPLAVVAALSPFPIIAVVLMLATPRARTNGPAFLLGWIVGITAVGTIVLLVSSGVDATDDDGQATWVSLLELALGLLLVALAVKQWRGRPRGDTVAELPKWMESVDHFQPPKAAAMGVLLSAANPKNLVLTVAAAAAIAGTGIDAGDEAIALAIFIIVATLGVGTPVVMYFVLGERSAKVLGELKSWMAANNAVIMAVITLVIGVKILGDGISGL
jgi:threonine/homoserine/homoserine lactone efflux protein